MSSALHSARVAGALVLLASTADAQAHSPKQQPPSPVAQSPQCPRTLPAQGARCATRHVGLWCHYQQPPAAMVSMQCTTSDPPREGAQWQRSTPVRGGPLAPPELPG